MQYSSTLTYHALTELDKYVGRLRQVQVECHQTERLYCADAWEAGGIGYFQAGYIFRKEYWGPTDWMPDPDRPVKVPASFSPWCPVKKDHDYRLTVLMEDLAGVHSSYPLFFRAHCDGQIGFLEWQDHDAMLMRQHWGPGATGLNPPRFPWINMHRWEDGRIIMPRLDYMAGWESKWPAPGGPTLDGSSPS